MGQTFFPDNIPDLVIATTTTITMATTYQGRPTRITIGGQQYRYSSAITINFATTGINALDAGTVAANTLYYIYAVVSGTTPGLVASTAAPSVGPTGYARWKEIGRCRTLQTAATLATITNRDGLAARASALNQLQNYSSPIISGFGTISSDSLQFQRQGSTMRLCGRFTTGTVAASAARITVPLSLTVGDTGTGAPRQVIGSFWHNSSVGTNPKRGVLGAVTGDNFVSFSLDDYTSAVSPFATLNGNQVVGSTVVVGVDVMIPIAEWVGLYT